MRLYNPERRRFVVPRFVSLCHTVMLTSTNVVPRTSPSNVLRNARLSIANVFVNVRKTIHIVHQPSRLDPTAPVPPNSYLNSIFTASDQRVRLRLQQARKLCSGLFPEMDFGHHSRLWSWSSFLVFFFFYVGFQFRFLQQVVARFL